MANDQGDVTAAPNSSTLRMAFAHCHPPLPPTPAPGLLLRSAPMPPFQTKPWEKTNIWITGIGLVTPLGMFREETWRNLKAGRTAARVLDVEPAEGAPPYIGCPVPSPDHQASAHVF